MDFILSVKEVIGGVSRGVVWFDLVFGRIFLVVGWSMVVVDRGGR